MPTKKPAVQKFRSAIHKSRRSTVASTWGKRVRIAGRRFRQQAPGLSDDFLHRPRRLEDHLPGNIGFHPLQLVIKGLRRDGHLFLLGLIGGMDGGMNLTSHQAHDVRNRREHQTLVLLLRGRSLEQRIETLGRKNVLHGCPHHHAHGCFLLKTLDQFTKNHCVASLKSRHNLKYSDILQTQTDLFSQLTCSQCCHC
jgi:hypothetical protein